MWQFIEKLFSSSKYYKITDGAPKCEVQKLILSTNVMNKTATPSVGVSDTTPKKQVLTSRSSNSIPQETRSPICLHHCELIVLFYLYIFLLSAAQKYKKKQLILKYPRTMNGNVITRFSYPLQYSSYFTCAEFLHDVYFMVQFEL